MNEKKFGEPLVNWSPPPAPSNLSFCGEHARLVPLADADAEELFNAFRTDTQGEIWDYLFSGPFKQLDEFLQWLASLENKADPYFFSIESIEKNVVCGMMSYLRIMPRNGSIEIGNIAFSPLLQRTIASTEALYLTMQWAFEQGYRRCEWKCDALNIRSRRAAQRLGFSYEGLFRQATHYKGRNRDTAWFAIIDTEWPALKECFAAYLYADNFDEKGVQKISFTCSERSASVIQGVRALSLKCAWTIQA